jgi:colicin import membrane protein
MQKEIFASVLLHFGALLIMVLSEGCMHQSPPPPPITMVTAVSSPVKKAKRVNRASQKESSKNKSSKQSKAKNKPKPPPQQPKPDTMTLKEKEKPKEKPVEKEEVKQEEKPAESNKTKREKLLEELRKQEKANPAPEGPTDREATSPEGVEDPTDGPSGAGPVDPVLAAYIESCRTSLLPNWTPLPTIIAGNPDLEVLIQVKVDEGGTMRSPTIITPSGDSSFDRSAIMAVHKTRTLPAPPERWRASAASGVLITLSAKDKR